MKIESTTLTSLTMGKIGQPDGPDIDISRSLWHIYAGALNYILTVAMIKVSIGIFLPRLLTKTWQRNIIRVVLALVTMYNTAYFFGIVFQCTPISGFWDHDQASVWCIPSQ